MATPEFTRREIISSALNLIPEVVSRIEVTVLVYHEVTYARLKNEIYRLLHRGNKPASAELFVDMLKKATSSSKSAPAFLLTLDDSRRSQYTEGLRALESIRVETGIFIPAVFFVIAKFNDPKVVFEDVEKDVACYDDGVNSYMTKANLVEIIKGGYSVQNHTVNHPDLTILKDDAAAAEIETTEERINALYELAGKKRTAKLFAYPYGAYNKKIEERLSSSVFDAAFLTSRGLEASWQDRFRIKRYSRN